MKRKQSAAHADTKTGLSFNTRLCGTSNVVTNSYQHGGKLSVELVADDGEEIAVLSVNMPECSHLLSDGEFFAKTWSENESIADDALASGIFRDSGRRSDNIVNAPIWTFK
jgi:hypothetical protein